MMRAAGAEPLEPYRSLHARWRSRCLTCDAEIWPRLSNARRWSACRLCASSFNNDDPASVYLFHHEGHRALKVGITNDKIERLRLHENRGWELVDLWSFDSGREALAVEHRVLRAWQGYKHAVAAEDMPQSGHTETVSLDDVTQAEAIVTIEEAINSLHRTPEERTSSSLRR